MRWLRQVHLTWFQLLCIRILKCGPMPKHIAFIMDGNRRFAEKNMMRKVDGHRSGFVKMSETLQWCIHFGIREVTVYAFSIDNFKRSKDEVDGLMNLARENFKNLLDEEGNIMANGVRIRLLGNIDMLPDDVKKLAAKITYMSKDNAKVFLNIAVAYSSQFEMVTAMKDIVQGVENKELKPYQVTEEIISKCMYTSDMPNPDLLVRTSGELRFSDFLLWQISGTCVYFTKQLWPEFSFWNFFMSILYYQRHVRIISSLNNYQLQYAEEDRMFRRTHDEDVFLNKLDSAKWEHVKLYMSLKC